MKLFGFIETDTDKIGLDKCEHEFLSFVICVGVAVTLACWLNILLGIGMVIGGLVTIVIDILKELYDKYIKKSIFDGQDLAADFIGLMRAEFTMLCFLPLIGE